MPNLNSVIAQQLAKGDVIWVPYRKDPLWPALINNVYPKKIAYSFFPLSSDDEPKKSRFSCAPKLTYAFVTTEALAINANEDLKKAYRSACEYLSVRGKTRGANTQSLKEANVKEKVKKEPKAKNEQLENRKRNQEESVVERDDVDVKLPPVKASRMSVSERSTPSGSQQLPSITNEKSELMMNTIEDRLEALINEIWMNNELVQCQKQTMKDKLVIKLKNNQFLKESDYEIVFERIINIIRTKNQSLSLISAFNITAAYIIPHVLISCYSTCNNMGYQTAKDLYHYQNSRVLGLDPSMSIPVTDHLEELCRLACDESDAIQK